MDQTLRRAGITDIADRRVDKLSGGQAQRVRFALAIVGECDLIVLDVPTTAMDVETRQALHHQNAGEREKLIPHFPIRGKGPLQDPK